MFPCLVCDAAAHRLGTTAPAASPITYKGQSLIKMEGLDRTNCLEIRHSLPMKPEVLAMTPQSLVTSHTFDSLNETLQEAFGIGIFVSTLSPLGY